MNKFLTIILAIFEFLFYTVLMVLVGSLVIHNEVLKLVLHFVSLSVIAKLLYFLIRFILNKLSMNAKKYFYLIIIVNLILGLIFPVFLIILIPSEVLTSLAIIILVSTLYYGLFINVFLGILNTIFTKQG